MTNEPPDDLRASGVAAPETADATEASTSQTGDRSPGGGVATTRRAGRGGHARRTEVSDGNGGGGRGRHARAEDGPRRPTRNTRRWAIEWVVIILIALAVAFGVRTFVAQTFFVPSTSMYPTLKAGDRIVVDKLAFHLHSVDRGDIVVFTTPKAENGRCGGPPVPDLVKRVIGLPNENISGKDGKVYITGKPLAEPWLPKVKSTFTANFGPVHVPSGDYFMMGDNRVESCDSRIWGPVSGSSFVGKVDLIIWPLSRFRFF